MVRFLALFKYFINIKLVIAQHLSRINMLECIARCKIMGMLDDVRILDFTHVYFGPYATMIMADMGADVIKIEPPWGEMIRMSPPFYGGVSGVFHYLDRNKRGISINMKDPKALEIVKELVKHSDVSN